MKVGFIGAGNMGSALASAAVKSGAEVYLYDKDEGKAIDCARSLGAAFKSNTEIASECDVIFLAVKPGIIPYAIKEIKTALLANANAVLVSMAAGVSVEHIDEAVGSYPVIRIMPNTPASVGEGMILWCANARVTEKHTCAFKETMASAGRLFEIDERLIDAASAVSGCGPAFVYMFIEALSDGGVECGLPRAISTELAAQTVLGAAKMILETGKHPGELKDAVCSPGGTTIEGVHALESGAFRATAANAVCAAYKKTLKVGK